MSVKLSAVVCCSSVYGAYLQARLYNYIILCKWVGRSGLMVVTVLQVFLRMNSEMNDSRTGHLVSALFPSVRSP